VHRAKSPDLARRASRLAAPFPGTKADPFEECSMLDVVMVALALGFFAVSVGYAYACDRL
jgi:hypothetical protein